MPTTIEPLVEHYGPGDHDSGSSQDAHGGGGGSSAITRSERFAIEDYSTDKFQTINNELRSGNLSQDSQAIVSRMDSALRKLEKRPGATARGFEIPEGDEGDRIRKMLVRGGEFSDAAYLSTSKRPSLSDMAAMKQKTPIPNHVTLRVEGKSGADISALSLNAGEAEVLYPRGTKFRVNKVLVGDNGGIIAEIAEMHSEDIREAIDGERVTIDDIRDAGEQQLQTVLAKLDKRHRTTLLAAVKRYGSVRAIPASVWEEIKRDTEENVVAALLLLMLAADEWTSEEFGGQGLDVRKASDRDVSIYSIKAARRAQRMADLTVETTRDRWARKFEDEALTGDGPVGSTTPEGNERSLDDVLDDARRKATAANETTGSISTGQIDAGRRAEEAAAKEAGRPGTTPTGTPAGDDGAQERPTQRVKVELIWKTERDNRVCPRCSPLEGTNEDVWGLVFPEGPGEEAHPNCRCWLSPQVVVDRVYEAVENCGANAPGGGGFQPGNTCGKKDSFAGLPKWQQKALKDQQKALTDDERNALETYMDSGAYDPINNYLRTGEWGPSKDSPFDDEHGSFGSFDDESLAWAKNILMPGLDSAIEKSKLPSALTVFRGVGNHDFEGVKRGDVIHDKGYVSTSVDRAVAEDFRENGAILKIKMKYGQRALYVEGISELTETQQEVLLPRGSRMKVKAVRNEGGRRVIHVDLLGIDVTESECGANAPGGGGFQKGNTCASGGRTGRAAGTLTKENAEILKEAKAMLERSNIPCDQYGSCTYGGLAVAKIAIARGLDRKTRIVEGYVDVWDGDEMVVQEEGHTWAEINGQIIDPTASQFKGTVYYGTSDPNWNERPKDAVERMGEDFDIYLEESECGANAPGGGGFQPGNTCAKGGGASDPINASDLRKTLPLDEYDQHRGTKELGAITLNAYRVGPTDNYKDRGGVFFAGDSESVKPYATLHEGYDIEAYEIKFKNALLAGHQNDLTKLFFKKSYGEMMDAINYRHRGKAAHVGSSAFDKKILNAAKKAGYDGIIYTSPAPPADTEIVVIGKNPKAFTKRSALEHYGPGDHDCGSDQQVHDGQGGACGGSGGGSNRGSSRSRQEEPSQPETPPQQPEPQPASQPERPRVSRAMSAVLDEARGIGFKDDISEDEPQNTWRGRMDSAFASNDTALFNFKTSSGRPFEMIAQPDRGYPTEIIFVDNEGSTLETGRGEAHEVFGKVSAAMIAYADKTQSDALSFSGAGASRVRLYHTLAKAFTRMRPDYEAYGGGDDSFAEFYLLKRGTPMHRKVTRSDEYLAQKIESEQPQLVEVEPEFDPAWLTAEWWDDQEKESTQA